MPILATPPPPLTISRASEAAQIDIRSERVRRAYLALTEITEASQRGPFRANAKADLEIAAEYLREHGVLAALYSAAIAYTQKTLIV